MSDGYYFLEILYRGLRNLFSKSSGKSSSSLESSQNVVASVIVIATVALAIGLLIFWLAGN